MIFAILYRIRNLYRSGLKIQRVLGRPLFVAHIEDLILWFEVRKFYIGYRLPVLYIYGNWAIVFVTVVTLGAVSFIVANILLASESDALDAAFGSPFNIMVSLCVLLFLRMLFSLLTTVVAISKTQSSHRNMLRHELVRLDAYGALFSRRLEEAAAASEQLKSVSSPGASSDGVMSPSGSATALMAHGMASPRRVVSTSSSSVASGATTTKRSSLLVPSNPIMSSYDSGEDDTDASHLNATSRVLPQPSSAHSAALHIATTTQRLLAGPTKSRSAGSPPAAGVSAVSKRASVSMAPSSASSNVLLYDSMKMERQVASVGKVCVFLF